MSLHINSPILVSHADYSELGKPLIFKMDALQPTGSFKIRGMGLKCQRAAAAGAKSFICASGGNAGYAAAYAAGRLKVAVTIVVPETTPVEARDAIARLGAEILVVGAMFDDANTFARDLARSRPDAIYLHPADDPDLWEGHASMIDEVVAAGQTFDCVVTSVGGGGLLAGIVEGLDRNGLANIPVIGVETVGADCLAQSLMQGKRVTLPEITSIATSLGARIISEHAYNLARSRLVHVVTVSDADAVAACLKFADAMRVLVEPACGATLAALDVHSSLLSKFKRPLVEICGGIGVTLDRLRSWKSGLSL